jgi:DNA-binding beta-propeller fold protein YncE
MHPIPKMEATPKRKTSADELPHNKETASAWARASRASQTFVEPDACNTYQVDIAQVRGIDVRGGKLACVGHCYGDQDGDGFRKFARISVVSMADSGISLAGGGSNAIPFGVALGADGTLSVGDAKHGVLQHFEPKNWSMVGGFMGEKKFRMGGIAHTPNGEFLVVDTINHRLHVFTAAGVIMGVFGGGGERDGEFISPVDVAVSDDGTIYVTDSGSARVLVFSDKFIFLRSFGIRGWGVGEFRLPMYIAVSGDGGSIFVSDFYHKHVQEFNGSGVYLRVVGWFGQETPLAVDEDGSLFVACGEGVVKKFLKGSKKSSGKKYQRVV